MQLNIFNFVTVRLPLEGSVEVDIETQCNKNALLYKSFSVAFDKLRKKFVKCIINNCIFYFH